MAVSELRIVHHTGAAPEGRTCIGRWRWDGDGIVVAVTLGEPGTVDVWWSREPPESLRAWYHETIQPELVERLCVLGGLGAALVVGPESVLLKAMKAHEN